MSTWVIVGASRGIGLEFVKQLLARGDRVIATVRDVAKASALWSLAGAGGRGACQLLECDVASEPSIKRFVSEIVSIPDLRMDYVILNAGILQYPNRATEMSFDEFAKHLHTNTIGPIITAQHLLKAGSIGTLMFMSSDSGSAAAFRTFEDGSVISFLDRRISAEVDYSFSFAAYAASKAALNQALRHMAAELRRKRSQTVVLAMHPGEVATDMANVSLDWEVEGIIGPEESVSKMLKVIPTKNVEQSGTFWTWEGKEYPW